MTSTFPDQTGTLSIRGTAAGLDADSGADTAAPDFDQEIVVLGLTLAASGERNATVPQGPRALGRS